MEDNLENIKESEEKTVNDKAQQGKRENIKKKYARRTFIVAIFSIICIAIAFIAYRGNYLEIKEIGEKYITAFNSNLKYKIFTIVVSFLWIFILMYSTNKRIKKGLKVFFDEEKKEIPKFPNKLFHFTVII